MQEPFIPVDPAKHGQVEPTSLTLGFGRSISIATTTKFDLDHVFSYHSPKDDQPAKYEAIRAAAKNFAKVVLVHTPECADQSAALRHIRDAAMTANAAVALDGRLTMAVKSVSEWALENAQSAGCSAGADGDQP
jgi:hypothetical protein